jgi:hypothetical protein
MLDSGTYPDGLVDFFADEFRLFGDIIRLTRCGSLVCGAGCTHDVDPLRVSFRTPLVKILSALAAILSTAARAGRCIEVVSNIYTYCRGSTGREEFRKKIISLSIDCVFYTCIFLLRKCKQKQNKNIK